MSFLNPFSRKGAQWTFAGYTSEFPDVDDDAGNLAKHRLCNAKSIPGCKAFHIPKEDPSLSKEVEIGDDALGQPLEDQVLVFQYKGKFHAVDHVSISIFSGADFLIELVLPAQPVSSLKRHAFRY